MARREPQLNEVLGEIRAVGGTGSAYAVDLSDLDAVDRLGATLLEEHGHVDVLVNNAARSIRRPVTESLQRYHDFERCMTLNFFAPVRLTRALLPSMLEARAGHVINSGTWGTLMPGPGFAAYNANKAALDSSGSIGSIPLERGLRTRVLMMLTILAASGCGDRGTSTTLTVEMAD